MYGAGIPAGEKEKRGLELESDDWKDGWQPVRSAEGRKTGDGSAATVCAPPERSPFFTRDALDASGEQLLSG